ncbi:Cupredoxin [Sordaria sp. MPI-SDFR-AT-0083]|nr:Cupredoxin [Sordaria sp. MPI-SDFR-AT-0083]
MKVTTAVLAALSLAPVALGKVAHNVYPDVRRGDIALEVRDKGNDNKNADANDNNKKNSHKATEQEIADLAKLIGLTAGLNAQLNLLWVNLGGGSVTTIINSAKTVTVTATQAVTVVNGAAGGEATAPPAADVPPAAPATPTEPAGVAAPVGGAASTHTVTVGGPQGLAFSPAQTQAAVGDTVIFTFLSQNHTVTQSAFDTPCVALPGGMDSGFQANVNNTVNPPPQVAMQVMVDTPLWFYCKQGNHCGKGMVFSINPTPEKTHAQFQAQAIAQNGTGTDSGITGGTASAAPPAAPSATVGGGGATAVAGGAAQATGNIVTGVGQVNADGSCVCAVACAAGSFPNIAAQGVNAFGGVGGSIPRAMALGAPAPA